MKNMNKLLIVLLVITLSGCLPADPSGIISGGTQLLSTINTPAAAGNNVADQRQNIAPSPQRQNIRLTDKESIRSAQTSLQKLGYGKIKVVDGIYGKKTRGAILAFQADKGLVPDGYVTDGLLGELRKACQPATAGVSSGMQTATQASGQQTSGESRIAKEGKQLLVTMGLVGGATGGVIGGIAADNKVVGAAVGTAVGAGAGVAAASIINAKTREKHQKYTADYNRIEENIRAADTKLSVLQQEIAGVDSRIAARKSRISALKKRTAKGKKLQAEAQSLLAEIEKDMQHNKQLSTRARENIGVLEKDIAVIDRDIAAEPGNKELTKKKDKLTQRKKSMQASLKRINAITPKLENQKENIASLLS